MRFYITTILFIILEHINKALTQGIPISPCPKMFQYRFDGTEWFGILSVRNPAYSETLHLKIILSLRGKPATNYLGEIALLTRGQLKSDAPVLYKVKFPKSHFPPKLLQISANQQIVCLGGADHGIFVTHIQLEHTRKFTFLTNKEEIPSTLEPTGPDEASFAEPLQDSDMSHTFFDLDTKHLQHSITEKNHHRPLRDICGTIDQRIRLQVKPQAAQPKESFNGTSEIFPRIARNSTRADRELPVITTAEEPHSSQQLEASSPTVTRGAWPWLAAIYVNNLTSLSYQCGGTLVSPRVVISAAHCFHYFKQQYSANEVLVFLGRNNLKNWSEEGSLAAPVDDIFIHPDFDRQLNTYDADLAVIVLKHEVRFNTFIRPACMWSGSTHLDYIIGEQGMVVGWGAITQNLSLYSSKSPNAVPKIVDATIVAQDTCFNSNSQLRSLSSNRTFCAGDVSKESLKIATAHNQLGLCTGDSGAGLMIFRNNRWILRGTVSATLPVVKSTEESFAAGGNGSNNIKCSHNQFVIYTDVAKFLDWIFAFII